MQKLDIFVSSLKHQVWRRYYYLFHKDEILESLKKRKGTCKRCGLCCQTSIRCSKLAYDENGLALCKVYDCKPYMCTIYPFKGQDFFKHLKEKCGYWYEDSLSWKIGTLENFNLFQTMFRCWNILKVFGLPFFKKVTPRSRGIEDIF